MKAFGIPRGGGLARGSSLPGRLIKVMCIAAAVISSTAHSADHTSSTWTIDSGTIDPQHYFGETAANGMIGIVSAPAPFRIAYILLNGAYEPLEPEGVDSIMRTLNFLALNVSIDGTSIDRMEQTRDFHQTLDMKRAALRTAFDYQDKATVVTSLRALRQLPYAAMFEVSIEARRPVVVSAASAIEPSFAHDVYGADDPHGSLDEFRTAAHEIQLGQDPVRSVVLCAASATGPTHRVRLAAAQTIAFDESGGTVPVLAREGSGLKFTHTLPAGGHLRFALIGTTVSSSHMADPLNQAQRLAATAYLEGIDKLIEQHESAWARLWESDIELDGDDSVRRDVHSMLYHLYSFVREGTETSIAPMGLSRDISGYLGHIFWDAETWMFPPLLVLHPELARSMLEYRFARLPVARANAYANGYRGAQFPWESAGSGNEDTPLCCMPLEVHITADVGIAAWNYYRVTHDMEWLRTRGYPLLEGTADFWVSRASQNADGSYSVRHVVAADEYATDVTDDAFTNAAARENLEAARNAARILGIKPKPEWDQIRKGLNVLKFPDGVTREYAGYSGGTIKQADVNLLAYPLHEVTKMADMKRDLDYYSSRVDQVNGPAMTKSVFAILYAKSSMPDVAYDLFRAGYKPNERPPFGVIAESAAASNPYFATGAGGLLETMLFGFGGLEISDRGLEQIARKLPPAWKSLTLTGIGINHERFTVQ
jgi:trehalose/maltose hydrolase-like predicted phosphorylase